eukprot:COSAG02_NODE_4731_length_5043_cov_3.579895_2_plen_168_part_00
MTAGRRLADLSKVPRFSIYCVAGEEAGAHRHASVVAQFVRRDQEFSARARLEPRWGVLRSHFAGWSELAGRLIQEEVGYAHAGFGSPDPPKDSLFGEPGVATYVRVPGMSSSSCEAGSSCSSCEQAGRRAGRLFGRARMSWRGTWCTQNSRRGVPCAHSSRAGGAGG